MSPRTDPSVSVKVDSRPPAGWLEVLKKDASPQELRAVADAADEVRSRIRDGAVLLCVAGVDLRWHDMDRVSEAFIIAEARAQALADARAAVEGLRRPETPSGRRYPEAVAWDDGWNACLEDVLAAIDALREEGA